MNRLEKEFKCSKINKDHYNMLYLLPPYINCINHGQGIRVPSFHYSRGWNSTSCSSYSFKKYKTISGDRFTFSGLLFLSL